MMEIADEIEHNPEVVRQAPHTTGVSRVDIVSADRKPNVRWRGR
jgi:glycine dehydrogenase subunit 2